MKATICVALTGFILLGCGVTEPVPHQSLAYPYVASLERQAQILSGMGRIKAGMSPSEVEAIMGKADIVLDLYNRSMFDPKPTGYTFWYIIQRNTDTGSAVERDEKLVRVTFDLMDRVTNVDFWGIDQPSDEN